VDGGQIRRAASLVAVRDGDAGDDAGPQVLVLERAAESRFLPSYVVFPGGAIDRDDSGLATRWFGDEGEAARAAAVRELVEEAGLALTAAGLVAADPDDPLKAIDTAPPQARSLAELCRWVAPEEVPVRFDARYFAVAAPRGLEPCPDGVEAARAWWVSPAELMAEWEAGRRKLYWPTWYTVSQLARCATVDTLLASRFEPREPDEDEVERLPRSVFWQD
jgi:8-oxo-dGTP pyrophosphatase MutT (NUDIX family)